MQMVLALSVAHRRQGTAAPFVLLQHYPRLSRHKDHPDLQAEHPCAHGRRPSGDLRRVAQAVLGVHQRAAARLCRYRAPVLSQIEKGAPILPCVFREKERDHLRRQADRLRSRAIAR